ncbi:hypothetical protein AB0H49_32085 [Nocardia sp. NPDC050713]|uniref:hypothetical protein n=1 Tax=Nocardia sp. NPDC050713 TaxID=3154511 RepID=UPI0033F29533
MVVIVFSLAVVAAFVLGFMLGRYRSTPRPPGRHSVAYFEMASEATMELPVIADGTPRHRTRPADSI